jgi:hypothetical protein
LNSEKEHRVIACKHGIQSSKAATPSGLMEHMPLFVFPLMLHIPSGCHTLHHTFSHAGLTHRRVPHGGRILRILLARECSHRTYYGCGYKHTHLQHCLILPSLMQPHYVIFDTQTAFGIKQLAAAAIRQYHPSYHVLGVEWPSAAAILANIPLSEGV